jgi:hypothetical protein
MAMEIRQESGTTFVDTHCFACGRSFRQLPMQSTVYAGYPMPERLGDLCPHCAGRDREQLRTQLHERAASLHALAGELERLADEPVTFG